MFTDWTATTMAWPANHFRNLRDACHLEANGDEEILQPLQSFRARRQRMSTKRRHTLPDEACRYEATGAVLR
jgi:hypothetical protein